MIKIMSRFSDDFVMRYYDNITESFLLERLPPYLKEFPEAQGFIDFYCDNLRDFIISEFNVLLFLQEKIDKAFPIISESYTPNIFYGNKCAARCENIEMVISMPLRGQGPINKIWGLKEKCLNELTEFANIHESYYVNLLRHKMLAASNAHDVKSICKEFKHITEEKINPHENMPEWVQGLSELLSYKKIPADLLTRLVVDIEMDFCPMCNESKIGYIIDDDNIYRPALDHFLPKSKYPQFSLSLYNLIPSCYTCNSLFKRDKDTFVPMHANPYILGSDDVRLFDLEELVLSVLYNNSSSVRIRIRSVGPEINNNMKLFKILGVYNKRSTKEDVISLVGQFKSYNERWKLYMKYNEFINEIIGFKNDKCLFEMAHGKLKKDMIEFFLDFKW